MAGVSSRFDRLDMKASSQDAFGGRILAGFALAVWQSFHYVAPFSQYAAGAIANPVGAGISRSALMPRPVASAQFAQSASSLLRSPRHLT